MQERAISPLVLAWHKPAIHRSKNLRIAEFLVSLREGSAPPLRVALRHDSPRRGRGRQRQCDGDGVSLDLHRSRGLRAAARASGGRRAPVDAVQPVASLLL
jgi:hypothetical protein